MEGDELIKTIDQVYYQDEATFNLNHITEKLPDAENLTSDYLLEYKGQLGLLLTVVTRKVSELILNHQPTYINELQRIADLQKSITESIRVCSDERRCLKIIKDGTTNGLTVVEHFKKRKLLANILDSLTMVCDLRKSVIETRNLIDNQEDFPRAIQMCKDTGALLAPYEKFKCVKDLRSKLNDTLELIGERMDTVLSQMFVTYDPEIYLKLKTAYEMMDRGEIASSQLLMHFNSYHNSSVEELKMFLENELWEMLPVKTDFTLVQLKEFAFLRETIEINNSSSYPLDLVLQGDEKAEATGEDLFGMTASSIHQESTAQGHKISSYFDNHEALPVDKISLSSDSDLDSELERDFVEEEEPPSLSLSPKGEISMIKKDSTTMSQTCETNKPASSAYRLTKHSGPVLTNSSLNVLRLAGRYIQMMTVLKPITYEILMKVYKLLDVYINFVFKKFGPDNDRKVGDVIASLRESLISPTGIKSDTIKSASEVIFGSQEAPQERSGTDKSNHIAVDPKKAIAIESLIFLVNQFWNLQEYLESLIMHEQRIQLHEQFSQNSHSNIPDFLKVRAELVQQDP